MQLSILDFEFVDDQISYRDFGRPAALRLVAPSASGIDAIRSANLLLKTMYRDPRARKNPPRTEGS